MARYNIEAHPYSAKSQQGGLVSTSPVTTIRKGRLNARAACTPDELRVCMEEIIVAQNSDIFRLGCVGIPNGCDKASLDNLTKEMQAKQRSLNAFIKQQRGQWPISTTFYTSLQLAYRTKNLSDLENYLNVLEIIKSNYQRDMGGEALLEIEAVKVELLLKLGRYGEALDTANNALIHWPHDEFLLYSKAQALIPALRLVAGVGEQQCADPRVHGSHKLLVHAQAQVAGPGEAVDAVWQQAADLGAAAGGAANDQRLTTHAKGMGCRLLEIANGGADGPGLKRWSLLPQPAQTQFTLAAAFAAHQLMPFVEHHGIELAKELLGFAVAEQQGERFGRGDQDLRRRFELLAALIAAAVAIANANPQRPAHGFNWF